MKKLITSVVLVGALAVSSGAQAGFDCITKSKNASITMQNILAGHSSDVIITDAYLTGGDAFVNQIANLVKIGVNKLNTDPRYNGLSYRDAIDLFENDILNACNSN